MSNIGENIRIIRRTLCVSRQRLAEKSGVSYGTISNIEHGENPRVETLRKIADALGISLDKIILPPESTAIVERSAMEMLVMFAVADAKITMSRGAEIMCMGVAEFRKWFNAKSEGTP